jgi:divalent metal cation (Fe/Co/Zn/Cd) transporter
VVGYPLADPMINLLFTVMILRIVWDAAKSVLTWLLDGVDPKVGDEIKHAARHVQGVEDVSEVRVRWLGHRLHAELNIAVRPELSVERGYGIATMVGRHTSHRSLDRFLPEAPSYR